MAKIKGDQIKKYVKIRENGFKVDVNNYLNGYHDKPWLFQIIDESENHEIQLVVRFIKSWDDRKKEYVVEINEYKREINSKFLVSGTGYFVWKYHVEKTERFNFNHMLRICKTLDVDDIKKQFEVKYQEYKAKRESK